MAYIYETSNFIVESFDTPHVSREDGGNLRILPKEKIENRTKLTPKQAIEFMHLTMVVGESFKIAMDELGIELMRINYQDMGNWAFKTDKQPFFHLHIYGRAKNAVIQLYTEAVRLPDRSTGFYDKFTPLNKNDCALIRTRIEDLFKEGRYSDKVWGL